MKNNFDEGFFTPLALTIVFSLSAVVMSVSMLAAANERMLHSYRNAVLSRKEAEALVYRIEKNIQILKDIPCDSAENQDIAFLLASDCGCDVSVCDVSTGIHRQFLSESFFECSAVRDYISSQGDSAFAEYGWIHPKLADKPFLESIASDFGTERPFPLVNTFPPLNIYRMSEEFLAAVLSFCGIKQAQEKAALIKRSLTAEPDSAEIAAMLGVSGAHPALDFIGTKTVFWEVTFKTKRCACSAVFAAVPDADSPGNIERYMLVKKRISYKGDAV